MIKVTLVTAMLGLAVAIPYPYPLTQEQLAQFVAAQQTAAGPPQRLVSVIPRSRQAYQEPDPAAAYQKASQAQVAAYQQQQQQAAADTYDEAQEAAAYQQQAVQQPQPIYYQQALRHRPQQVAYVDQSQLKKYKLRPSPAGLGANPKEPVEDYDPNPQYQFSFDIKDDESTNYHNRKETRDGDKISGSYSVVDSDGYIRTVTYTADPLEGFKADVSRQPTDIVVKLPKHPTPGIAQQYQQLSPSQALLARKQQTQQYLEASSTVDDGQPQYVVRPQQTQVYLQPQRAAGVPSAGIAAYSAAAPHRLAPVPTKTAKAYATPQHVGTQLLYRPSAAYQQ